MTRARLLKKINELGIHAATVAQMARDTQNATLSEETNELQKSLEHLGQNLRASWLSQKI